MNASAPKIVLYVEDHEPNVFLVEAIFATRADIKIISAPNGQAGLFLAQEKNPDLILLDLHLPDMHGEEFLRTMRLMPELAKIPLIVLSADASCDSMTELKAMGVVEFISKPFDIDYLTQAVDNWLRN